MNLLVKSISVSLLLADTSYTPQPELKDRYKSHNGYTTSAIFGDATCRSRPQADIHNC